uniref:SSD domain-containing protein n=1 Tax=Ascaris lumbricoides TaxID=6252 RepID=A0A9J2Q1I5_ASCLU
MAITFDPRIGFETRGTPLSNQRLAIQNLLRSTARSNEFTSLRIKKNASFNITIYDEESESLSDITVAYDEYGVDSSPTLDDIHGACDQYFALGTFIPYNYIEQLSKIIFRVASFDSIIVSLDGSEDFTFYNALLNNLQRYYSKGELLLVIFRVMFFPFLNLLAIVLIIAVGADDAFLFLYQYRKHKKVICRVMFFPFLNLLAIVLIIAVGADDAFLFLYQYRKHKKVIFRVMFFPFLNLLAIVLIIAVGADDAFLFLYQYRKHKKEMKATLLFVRRISAEEISSDDEKIKRKQCDRIRCCLSEALSHAAVAMFVTSATTAVAFYANLASKIVVLR